ncbi:MAG: hypothetical protein MI747_14785 [Desulfobacterales bacterium]|nr:hypothetical protein [Desulfobacterales bacterium]
MIQDRYQKIVNFIVGTLVFIGLLAWFSPPVPAVPGKLYTNVGANDTNTDHITGTVPWLGGFFFAGIAITDSTNYVPPEMFYNTGNITLTNHGFSGVRYEFGIGSSNVYVETDNRAAIAMTMTSVDQNLDATGIHCLGPLYNHGSIRLQLQGANNTGGGSYEVDGLGYFSGWDDASNAGDIQVNVIGGTTLTGGSTYAVGRGMRYVGVGDNLTNSGAITIRVQGGEGTGSGTNANSLGKGIYTMGHLVNTGVIDVRAVAGKHRPNSGSTFSSGNSTVYGIHVDSTISLDSRALIHVDAQASPGLTGGSQNAYQVYVDSGTTTLKGYAMALGSQAKLTADYNGTIKVDSGASLVFNSTVLYLSITPDFTGQVEYEIPMLEQGAAPQDQFSSISPLPSEYKASLENGNGTGLQKLIFEFDPEEALPLVSSQIQNEFNAQGHSLLGANVVNGIISDLIPSEAIVLSAMDDPERLMASLGGAGRPLPILDNFDHGNSVFASPVILRAKDESESGYTAENNGFLCGYTREMGAGFYLGGHAGFSKVQVDYTGIGSEFRSEAIDTYSLGGHAIYLHGETLLVSAMVTGFYGETIFQDRAPTNLESAEYDSHSLRADLALGKLFSWGWQTLLPEVGFTYVYNHRQAFETTNLSNPDVFFGAMDEYEFYGRLGLKWFGRLALKENWSLHPSLGIGFTRTLSDGRFSNRMGIGEISKEVIQQSDHTQFTPRASISWVMDRFELVAGYSGGFSKHTENYLFWIQMGVHF